MDAAQLEERYNRELEEMTDELCLGINASKEALDGFQEVFAARTKQAAVATDTFVRANPWAALGIGAAFGCLVGFLIGRKD